MPRRRKDSDGDTGWSDNEDASSSSSSSSSPGSYSSSSSSSGPLPLSLQAERRSAVDLGRFSMISRRRGRSRDHADHALQENSAHSKNRQDDARGRRRRGAGTAWLLSLHRLVLQRCPVALNRRCNVALFLGLLMWMFLAGAAWGEDPPMDGVTPGGGGHKNPSRIRVAPHGALSQMEHSGIRVPSAGTSLRGDTSRIPADRRSSFFQKAVNGFWDVVDVVTTDHDGNLPSHKKKKNREVDAPGCVRPDWHSFSFPTCNDIHEVDLRRIVKGRSQDPSSARTRLGYVSAGLWRSVWAVFARDESEVSVLKVMKGEHEVNPRNVDRHRRDALVMERLTESPNVVDIYGFCGNTVLTEFAPRTLDDVIYSPRAKPVHRDDSPEVFTRQTTAGRLDLAVGVMKGLAAIHDIDGGPIVHADIQAKQFLISSDGHVKINDFNRCRFMAHRRKDQTSCLFQIPTSPGKSRSPEEYSEALLDEKLDVYSTANVLYGIITGTKAWYQFSTSETKSYVKKGAIPVMDAALQQADTADHVLVNLTELAFEVNPNKRISAGQFLHELEQAQRHFYPTAP